MSLRDIQLTPLIINELYRDLLVDITDHATQPPLPGTEKHADKAAVSEWVPTAFADRPPNPVDRPLPRPVTEPVSTLRPVENNTDHIKFLGGNKKRIAFVVNSPNDVYLPDAELDWLGKMLEACRLNLGDVAIANIAGNKFSITDIKNELFSTIVILLGTEPSAIQLPINFPPFNLQSHDGIVFLATPPPRQLNQSTAEAKLLKSKLWVCLQKLFKLA
ncbi:MAG TPA: hypothetical protein VD993_02255 [Chitinophagaceae bacterium]|nr:hypothetical protein [Chitinophagaceae bacterium]